LPVATRSSTTHELFLTVAERITLIDDMRALLDLSTDRFMLLRLDPRSRVHTLGKAVQPADPDYFSSADYAIQRAHNASKASATVRISAIVDADSSRLRPVTQRAKVALHTFQEWRCA